MIGMRRKNKMITKNYIKMCEQAEEIQKLLSKSRPAKEWKHSHFVEKWRERNYRDIEYEEFCLENLEGRIIIWLPTQEQLQELILKIFSPFTKAMKFVDFISNYIKLYQHTKNEKIFWTDLYPIALSLNELWLMYVMYEKYHKIWTGRKWEEEK